jgi:elongation factor Tu
VTGIEMFRKLLDIGIAGDNIGVLLRGIERNDIERGQVFAKPGSIKPHTEVQSRSLRALEGRGRPSHAVLRELPPAVLLPHDRRDRHDRAARGRRDGHARRQHQMDVELITPIACEEGLRFAIREGGRTVGAGVVTAVSE